MLIRHRTTTLDALIGAIDSSLRTVLAPARAARPLPDAPDLSELSADEARLSGALMRVNHVGEVCAQALYTSQALGARLCSHNEALAQHLEDASREETDHLAWTQTRLTELNDHTSRLNPLWYSGAFAIGLVAAALGRATSLGFVVETERQVEAHLDGHLDRLPPHDTRSKTIVALMKADEAAHAQAARAQGARELPTPIQGAMRLAAKAMTTVAHRI
jgi:3-demethoxyubiquinol 3-hydroxylase